MFLYVHKVKTFHALLAYFYNTVKLGYSAIKGTKEIMLLNEVLL